MNSLPPPRANSRLKKLLIVFAITASIAATYYLVDYGLNSHSAALSPVRSAARAMGIAPAPNYSKIDEGLWMGGYVDQPPPGTQAVLNLCGSNDPYHVESYKVSAINDGLPVPNLDWLARQVDFIESERAAGHTVYVHCAAGISRSGMVTAAYLMRHQRWSADEAIRFIQSKRPAANPNPVFRPLLAEWERSLKPTASSGTTQP